MEKVKIVVKEVKEKHFVAGIDNRPEIYGVGRSSEEAVGDLIVKNWPRFPFLEIIQPT